MERLKEQVKASRVARIALVAVAGAFLTAGALAATLGGQPESETKAKTESRSNEGKRVETNTSRRSPEALEKNADRARPAKKPANAVSSGPTSPEDVRQSIEHLPDSEISDFARRAALSVLASLGYPGSSVALSDDRSVVIVKVPREYACGTDSHDVEKIAAQIRKIVIFTSEVRVYVANGGGPIASYVTQRCPALKAPEANGKLVWAKSGTGLRGSGPFEITARRWTVSYVNGGGRLEIYVGKGEKQLKPVIKSDERETSSATYKGPGEFNVTVAGAGQWKVRVFDGR